MECNSKIFGIITVFIIGIIFVYSIGLIQEGGDYQNQYLSCIDKYNTLVNDYNNVLESNNLSTGQVTDYNEVVTKYNDVVENYNELLEDYKTLKENSLSPPFVQISNRTVELNFYFKNESKLQTWSWPLESLEDSFFKGQIMREKEISEMDKYLPGISSKFNNTRYLILENQLVINLNPYIETEHFDSFGKYVYNKYSTDEERINAVWYVTTSLYEYTQEIEETPRLPLETLLGAGGDCEDTSVLAASILKAMNSNWKVELVYVDLDNLEDPKEINHVLVYVDTGEYSTHIETTGNIEINPYSDQNITGFYYGVE